MTNKHKFFKVNLICIVLIFYSLSSLSQGRNAMFLVGYNAKARMVFTDTSYSITPESRQIPFDYTQANISDENGNILMSSNGIYIADATGDTMLNGGGLNPGQLTIDFTSGLPMPYADLFLPMPGDTNKYVLFHQIGDYNASIPLAAPNIFYTIVDMSLNNNLGAVVSKNNVAASGLFGWGLSACKHGNGRDWWVVALSAFADSSYLFLVTPDTIQLYATQFLCSPQSWLYGGQPVFSPDGSKFAFGGSYDINGMNYLSHISLFNFDRCNGTFNLDTTIDYSDNYISGASAFSSNSKYLYFASQEKIYQYDTDASGLLPYINVATNDTFASPPPFYTSFWLMFLAANGKIYISSGNSVKQLHEINFPDSTGTACDVNLHNINTNCFYYGAPNHPNYYLGHIVGSQCDSLTSIPVITHDFKFKIFPNPITDGNIKIMYLLPQKKKGVFEVYDINSKMIFSQILPQWSTIQNISLPNLTNGIYNCSIISDLKRINKKIVVLN